MATAHTEKPLEAGNDDAAEVTAHQVVLRHRVQANRMVDLVSSHVDALDFAVTHRDLLRREILEFTASDPNGKRRAKLLKMISPGAHASTLVTLAGNLETAIQLERQAYGLGPHELPPELAQTGGAASSSPSMVADADFFDRMRARVEQRLKEQREQTGRADPPESA